jgi:hypothetical protein
MAMGMRNTVTSARQRRSRTSRRLVDSPRKLAGDESSWIAGLQAWGRGVRPLYALVGSLRTGTVVLPRDGTNGCTPPTHRARHDWAVFILYAVVAGIVIGLLTGGSASRLGDLHFRWAPLIAVGMAGQVLLFSTPLGGALGPAAPAVYVASNLAVLAAVWRNLAIPGLRLVLIGGASNLITIAANGGYMPVSAEAVAAMGRLPKEGYSNSRLLDGVILGPLTDIFAMPTWIPLANVFSIGDLLIGVGAAMAVLAAMHGRGPLTPRPVHAARSEPA